MSEDTISKEAQSSDEAQTTPILSRLRPPAGAVKRKRRKGRGIGSGLGKTAGKGMKGMKARHPGGFSKLGFEGGQMPLYRRIPKFGFKAVFSDKVVAINISELSKRFDAGATVDPQALADAGLAKGKFDRIKILGDGELDKALTVSAHGFSKSAKEKIEKAGGSTSVIEIRDPGPPPRAKKSKAEAQ